MCLWLVCISRRCSCCVYSQCFVFLNVALWSFCVFMMYLPHSGSCCASWWFLCVSVRGFPASLCGGFLCLFCRHFCLCYLVRRCDSGTPSDGGMTAVMDPFIRGVFPWVRWTARVHVRPVYRALSLINGSVDLSSRSQAACPHEIFRFGGVNVS